MALRAYCIRADLLLLLSSSEDSESNLYGIQNLYGDSSHSESVEVEVEPEMRWLFTIHFILLVTYLRLCVVP